MSFMVAARLDGDVVVVVVECDALDENALTGFWVDAVVI